MWQRLKSEAQSGEHRQTLNNTINS